MATEQQIISWHNKGLSNWIEYLPTIWEKGRMGREGNEARKVIIIIIIISIFNRGTQLATAVFSGALVGLMPNGNP